MDFKLKHKRFWADMSMPLTGRDDEENSRMSNIIKIKGTLLFAQDSLHIRLPKGRRLELVGSLVPLQV